MDFFNGKVTLQTLYLRDEVKRHEILLGDLILCEVLQGFRSDSEFLKARQLLLSFPCQNISGPVLALQTAQNYRYLRTKGVTVRKTIDMMIATFCIENHHELLHADRDFEVIEQYLPLLVRHP
ncbi:MAG: VapC toxin family PIN domain ribonuclease [Thiotrichaceae bacterium IS1]|nr:MAG: VapC toxin family PIN domain ribonuclease [Thiotrichaceae bacterium IS1]